MLPTEVLADVATKRLTAFDVTLYSALLFWEGKNEKLWFGIPSMAREIGVSKATISRSLERLDGAGHVRRTKRMGVNWLTKCLTKNLEWKAVHSWTVSKDTRWREIQGAIHKTRPSN